MIPAYIVTTRKNEYICCVKHVDGKLVAYHINENLVDLDFYLGALINVFNEKYKTFFERYWTGFAWVSNIKIDMTSEHFLDEWNKWVIYYLRFKTYGIYSQPWQS
jgi:hypothetical protein